MRPCCIEVFGTCLVESACRPRPFLSRKDHICVAPKLACHPLESRLTPFREIRGPPLESCVGSGAPNVSAAGLVMQMERQGGTVEVSVFPGPVMCSG